MVAWSDAAWANRPGGLSTGGYAVGVASISMREGLKRNVGWVSHRSGELGRAARSSLSAEVQALTQTEDETFMIRALWAKLSGKVWDVEDIKGAVREVPARVLADQTGAKPAKAKRSHANRRR